ncbi:alpha/beta hydrolase fold domain-containing protein, partial [Hafnia sp.]|uniref:alpha/beta hydrolase fold domain-containing protein n=1 Tax=Hafnia sp. TaxID=1873498 RepID=UPI002FC5E6CE
MRSFKSHLFKYAIKRHFAQADLDDVATMRKQMDELGEQLPLAQGTHLKSVEPSGIYAEWLIPSHAHSDAAILYLHGGAYHMGSCSSHRSMASYIADAANIPLLLADYRLAPESPYPAALNDAETVYRWLLTQSDINPKRIFVMGDSAGGGLALALTLRIKSDSALPLPAGVAVLSPWADLSM